MGVFNIFKVYTTEEILEQKDELISKYKFPDIYYMPSFLRLSEISGEGKGKFALAENNNDFCVFPFLERDIQNDLKFVENINWKDAFSPYGYGGIYSSNNDKNFINKFRMELNKYYNKNNIVSEFVRCHPLLNTENNFDSKKLDKTGRVVYFDLNYSVDNLKEELDNSTQRNIKKARRNGLELDFDFDMNTLRTFKTIYKATMDRVGAEPSYYFSDEYYKFIKDELKDNAFIVNVIKDDEIIASSIFFIAGDIIQYHLGASKADSLKFRPNDLLFYEVALWGKKSGYKLFNLGGGLGGKEDSLFRFKNSFSKNTAEFYTVRNIIDKDKYDYLTDKWQKNNPDLNIEDINYFPVYRK